MFDTDRDSRKPMIVKDWRTNKRALTEGERLALDEIKEQGAGGVEESLNYAAVTLRAARTEQERLEGVIRDLRLEVQRLEFPGLYPPDIPEGAERVAARIYQAAQHIKELMEREGMQGDYDLTYNSMAEIASLGKPLCAASNA